MNALDALMGYLRHFQWRIRLYDGWYLFQRTLWVSGLAGTAILLVGRFWPIEHLKAWAVLPLALWFAAVLVMTYLKPLTDMCIALRVDAHLGLKERLSTSLDLDTGAGKVPSVNAAAAFEPALVSQLHADALAAAQKADLRSGFPLRVLRWPLAVGLMLLIAATVLAFLPNPMDDLIAERQAATRQALQQAAIIDELHKEIEQSQDLTPEDKEALLRRLEELARQLRQNPGDRQQALADISRTEEALRRLQIPNSAGQQAALEQMAARLQEIAGLEKPDPESAEALEKIAELSAEMSESERQEAAASIAELSSRASQAGNQELAQSLAALSQAMQSGDQRAVAQAAKNTKAAAAQSQRILAGQAAIQKSLSACQNTSKALTKSGKPGSGQGQGKNPGQGSGGGGTNASNLPPAAGSQMRVPMPFDALPASGEADQLDSQIYVPRQQAGSPGNEMFIPGQETGQGQEEIRESGRMPGQINPAIVPYRAVYMEYRDAADKALEQSYVPDTLKAYIRDYFTQLEP